ncbi:lycopene cyclase [Flavobacterium noncentrifugens]|uniref:Lycopene beta-cyclase n=1 Tax=Flavobacterium noncentrifugens TaxID=1128970 RepID=A0A1G8T707_9FLAO|nr:lycopene cyclase family protein [Flavobacterium noncentrifugens]GEP50112.1 lycopene cyclase [Flavobacterium noncentrifugens]SDJ37273.1 lycopene beta-cyclase [Flavobacterium noncentrifugens]
MKHYDYIFAGAGLSALMAVYEIAVSGKFSDKSILLLDADSKKTNDRTWCFWEKPNGKFDAIVSKKWKIAWFAHENFRRILDLNPYQYKMICGLDFYNFVFVEISLHPYIHFINQKVNSILEKNDLVFIETASETFSCNKLFNSIYDPKSALSQQQFPVLQQHFIGWKIKTVQKIFNPELPTFMDFSIPQNGNTRFMYVLPTSENEALLEYTLFSKDLLPEKEYENAIEDYIQKLGISTYEIIEKERGQIPMTSYQFWKKNTKNILNIGSAGGWTKASTGYTFKNTIKKSKALIEFSQHENDFTKFHKTNKFWFYDLLLLDILSDKNHLGSSIFSSMFKSGNPALIFKFLDEETSLYEDLKVILKCPKRLFISALINRIFKNQPVKTIK